jgi:hypothetical protein
MTSPTRQNRDFGWWSLLCWLTLGLALESLHGFKVGWYLDVTNEARRLQLTLAHSHGTLLALVNLAFAANVSVDGAPSSRVRSAARCLRWAGILMPAGFLLGGVFVAGPDPGLGIVLVPLGGVLLFTGILQAIRSNMETAAPDAGAPPPERAARRSKGRA